MSTPRLYQLGPEHDAVRALSEKEIMPHAADVDERERYRPRRGRR